MYGLPHCLEWHHHRRLNSGGCYLLAAYKYTDVLLDSLQGFIVSVTFCYRNGEVGLSVLIRAFFCHEHVWESFFNTFDPGISCPICPLKIKDSNSDFLSSFLDFFKTFVFDVDNDKAPPFPPNLFFVTPCKFFQETPLPYILGRVRWWQGALQIITLLKRSHSSWRSNRLMEMAARREGSWRGPVGRKWEILTM